MKIGKFALSAMLASACFAGSAFGQGRVSPYQLASYNNGCACASSPASCDLGVCDPTVCDALACDGACDSGCGCGSGCGLLGGGLADRCCDDPWTLCDGDYNGWVIGGWSNVGYHTAETRCFNTYEDTVQLHQAWMYAEKIADGSCGLGLGGRIDYLYGTDGPDTQAFGVDNGHWDTSWDNGIGNTGYGHALPQVYGEVAYGDFSAKVGHFFTIIGNEVVAATGNFFYSRQFTFYNAEPFTHTGVLTNYQVNDEFNVWNGYVLGWDSGFEDNGDAYLGGFSRAINDYTTLIGTTALGRFNDRLGVQERGEIFSTILTTQLTDRLSHISQTDLLYTNGAPGNFTGRNTYGNINYLIYQINDCVAFGQRFEYFNLTTDETRARNIKNADVYNYTVGMNYKPIANLTWRPEMRFIWDRERIGFVTTGQEPQRGIRSSYAVFGNDLVFTY